MMAILDKPLRKVAKTLIKRFGTTITLVKRGSPVYDIASGASSESRTEYEVKAIIEDYNARELQEGLIQVGDRRVLIATSSLAFVPTTSDQVILETVIHNIISVQDFYSGDQSAVFSLQVRK